MAEFTAADYLDRDVSIVPAGTEADEQRREMARSGHMFAVVVDDERAPVALTTWAGMTAVLAVESDTPMELLVIDQRIAGVDGEPGLPAVVVLDESGVVGVVPAPSITDYARSLNLETRAGSDDSGAFQGLPGYGVGEYTPLRLRCQTCGRVNERETFMRGVDLCDNGHLLIVDR